MTTITERHLAEHLDDLLDRVLAGEWFIVTLDGREVAELRPLPSQPNGPAGLNR
jgi:antitoxin (DNA-binding transcriptional repressor) of toxin-antitoxin stability system